MLASISLAGWPIRSPWVFVVIIYFDPMSQTIKQRKRAAVCLSPQSSQRRNSLHRKWIKGFSTYHISFLWTQWLIFCCPCSQITLRYLTCCSPHPPFPYPWLSDNSMQWMAQGCRLQCVNLPNFNIMLYVTSYLLWIWRSNVPPTITWIVTCWIVASLLLLVLPLQLDPIQIFGAKRSNVVMRRRDPTNFVLYITLFKLLALGPPRRNDI